MQVVVEGAGFEPAKSFRTPDLQSGGFNHSPTPPGLPVGRQGGPVYKVSGAPEGTRTPNWPITSRLRYRCATGAGKGRAGRAKPRNEAIPAANRLCKKGL